MDMHTPHPLSLVATVVGVSRQTFWRWVKDGKVPGPVTVNGAQGWTVREISAIRHWHNGTLTHAEMREAIDRNRAYLYMQSEGEVPPELLRPLLELAGLAPSLDNIEEITRTLLAWFDVKSSESDVEAYCRKCEAAYPNDDWTMRFARVIRGLAEDPEGKEMPPAGSDLL